MSQRKRKGASHDDEESTAQTVPSVSVSWGVVSCMGGIDPLDPLAWAQRVAPHYVQHSTASRAQFDFVKAYPNALTQYKTMEASMFEGLLRQWLPDCKSTAREYTLSELQEPARRLRHTV